MFREVMTEATERVREEPALQIVQILIDGDVACLKCRVKSVESWISHNSIYSESNLSSAF